MKTTKKGKFCESCSKNIVDLTDKTDRELIEFFKQKKDDVCGRLLSSQLHRELVLPPQKNNWNWLLPVAFGATLINPHQTKAISSTYFQIAHNDAPSVSEKQNFVSETPENDIVKGKVIDSKSSKPLQNVKVKYKNFNNVIAITDSLGSFEIKITEEFKNEILVFEAYNYPSIEKFPSPEMLVILNEYPRIILGGISPITTRKEPLYIINSGKQSCVADSNQFAKIKPEWIENLKVLKDASATAIYGSKAANGVIIMEIKKAYKKNIDFSKKNKYIFFEH